MTLKVNYCRTCGGSANFGDQLTPAFLDHAGIPWEFAAPHESDLVMVGSIISKLPHGYAGTILGTGTIREGIARDLSQARVLAVRGALTREACKLPKRTELGDMGILAPDLVYTPKPTETRPIGGTVLVPHYVDKRLSMDPRRKVLITRTPTASFVWAIRKADRIVTSSLHGLITADALGIPHALAPHPDVIGGLWKFNDYLTAFGLPAIKPGETRLTPSDLMAERQAALRALLPLVASY